MRGYSEHEDYANFEMARRVLKASALHVDGEDCTDADDEYFLTQDLYPAHEWTHQALLRREHASHSGAGGPRQTPSPTARELALERRVQVLEEHVHELREDRDARQNFTATFVKSIVDIVRTRAEAIEGVTGAYVRPDGLEFILTGPIWTEALSAAGAALAIEAQRSLAPSGTPYIEGSFIDMSDHPGPDWIKAFP